MTRRQRPEGRQLVFRAGLLAALVLVVLGLYFVGLHHASVEGRDLDHASALPAAVVVAMVLVAAVSVVLFATWWQVRLVALAITLCGCLVGVWMIRVGPWRPGIVVAESALRSHGAQWESLVTRELADPPAHICRTPRRGDHTLDGWGTLTSVCVEHPVPGVTAVVLLSIPPTTDPLGAVARAIVFDRTRPTGLLDLCLTHLDGPWWVGLHSDSCA